MQHLVKQLMDGRNSKTLEVLSQLAGAAWARWGEITSIDVAVAATARAGARRP